MEADYERIGEMVGTVEEVAKRLGFALKRTSTSDTIDGTGYGAKGAEITLVLTQKNRPQKHAQEGR